MDAQNKEDPNTQAFTTWIGSLMYTSYMESLGTKLVAVADVIDEGSKAVRSIMSLTNIEDPQERETAEERLTTMLTGSDSLADMYRALGVSMKRESNKHGVEQSKKMKSTLSMNKEIEDLLRNAGLKNGEIGEER